jgi:hypothetical protein
MPSRDGLREVAELFGASGLGRPPVPSVLRESFRSRGEWFFASRDMEPGYMYGFREYPIEAVTADVGNYVAVSHAGHGINSYAITYHLIYGRLALFAQTSWGGVYADADADAAAVADQLDRCARLIEAYERYVTADLLPPAPARLVVIESDLGGSGTCRWLPEPISDSDSAIDWLEAPRDLTDLPIKAAHHLLEHPDLSFAAEKATT